MPLAGTGNLLGDVLAAAVKAPAAAGSFFQMIGQVIAAWAPEHIAVLPGAMAATSGAVSGLGTFRVDGDAEDLGGRFCDVLKIPPAATEAREKWVATAAALIDHFNDFGQANGTGLTSGSPCGGQGTVQWQVPSFVPPLSVRLKVHDLKAAAALEIFSLQLLQHIASNAAVVGLSLSGPPLSAPTDGVCTGSGTIT
jgi:hypothetical protein